MEQRSLPIGGCLLGIIGLGLVIAGAVYGYMRLDYNLANFTVRALVTGNATHTQFDAAQNQDITVYCPTVQYTAYPGNAFTWESPECTPEPIYAFGDYIEIVYPLASPGDAQLTSSLPKRPGIEFAVGLGLLGICVGAAGIALVVVSMVVARKKTNASASQG